MHITIDLKVFKDVFEFCCIPSWQLMLHLHAACGYMSLSLVFHTSSDIILSFLKNGFTERSSESYTKKTSEVNVDNYSLVFTSLNATIETFLFVLQKIFFAFFLLFQSLGFLVICRHHPGHCKQPYDYVIFSLSLLGRKLVVIMQLNFCIIVDLRTARLCEAYSYNTSNDASSAGGIRKY